MGDQASASDEAVTEAASPTSPENATSVEMAKVYIGNLPNDFEEDGLRSLLTEKSAPEAETVLVKRGGYAFLEYTEQSKADEVISLMDGKQEKSLFTFRFHLVIWRFFLSKKLFILIKNLIIFLVNLPLYEKSVDHFVYNVWLPVVFWRVFLECT